jgi:hypothetical protein
MEAVRDRREMASRELLRSTRWLGEGMEAGREVVAAVGGEPGRGENACPCPCCCDTVGAEGGRGGGDRRDRLGGCVATAAA